MFWNKMIILRSESYISTFWICMDAMFLSISRFNNNYFGIQLIILRSESYIATFWIFMDAKISSDKKRLFFAVNLYHFIFRRKSIPFHFSRILPFSEGLLTFQLSCKTGKLKGIFFVFLDTNVYWLRMGYL